MEEKGRCDRLGGPKVRCGAEGVAEYYRAPSGMLVQSFRCPAHSGECPRDYQRVTVVPYDAPPPEPPARPVTSETCPHGAEKCLRCTEHIDSIGVKLAVTKSEREHFRKLAGEGTSKLSELRDCLVLRDRELKIACERLAKEVIANEDLRRQLARRRG